MSIFQHPLLLVFLSFLVCPVASQTGQKVKEVNSGLCTGAELIGTAADCQAAGKVLGLGGTVGTESSVNSPPGCIWGHWGGYDRFFFNTNNASTTACGSGSCAYVIKFVATQKKFIHGTKRIVIRYQMQQRVPVGCIT